MTDPVTGADRDLDRRVAALTDGQRRLLDRLLGETPDPVASPRESLLADIWAACLDLDTVGIDDDYFQLGGDSVTAIMIVARANAAGLHLSAHDVFEQRTIRKLAATAFDLTTPAENASRPPSGEFGLTPVQQGMLFHVLADPAGAAYLAHASCTVDGALDPRALIDACAAATRRHPALRTAFRWDGPQPRQVVAASATVLVTVRDLLGLPGAERDKAVADHIADDRTRPFDLTVPPLLRIGLLRVADTSWMVSLTHHHLVLDGWSQQQLLRELLDEMHGAATSPVEPFDFGGYVSWAAERDGKTAEEHWRHTLSGFVPTPLATVGSTSDGPLGTTPTTVDSATGRAITEVARVRGLTVAAVLYGGWALTTSVLTGIDDVCFGVTVAGRPALPGATTALGNFVATLPLRTTIDATAGTVDWLADLQRRRTLLDEHRHTPLTRIGRLLPPGTGPLFDSIVVVENFPQLIGEHIGGLRIRDVHASIDEGYPVVLEVHPGPPIVLRLRTDRTRFDTTRTTAALAAITAYLDVLADRPDCRIDEMLSAMRTAVRTSAGRSAGLLTARRQVEVGDDD